ncbi:histidinol-phosphatase [Candidatus Sumerlaeota bacterium]|nr:histidinol-phosphatase [Candidatus Sumerlaeota bacterium]
MGWTNYHTHCHFCDGEAEPEAYVQSALRQGLLALGFSSHAPLPFPTHWTMDPGRLDDYLSTIRALQKKYADKLPIFLGLEIDYIPGVISPGDARFQALGLDYIIGSVHFFGSALDGLYPTIDGTEEEFLKGINGIFKGNIRLAVESYYQNVRSMVQMSTPDIIGHLDIIKKNNKQSKYFSEDETWYRQTVSDTLTTIAESNAIVEVNTGGIARKRTDSTYPSPWILERIRELNIPITLSSDVHSPELITGLFRETATLLLDIGFTHLYVLTPTGWQPRPFSPEGVEYFI